MPTLEPPFLRKIIYAPTAEIAQKQPNALKHGFELELGPMTILVGDNGCGKSTIIESVAKNVGLPLMGGSNYTNDQTKRDTYDRTLNKWMIFSWLPRIRAGFFVKSQSFLEFSRYIDDLRKDPQARLDVDVDYGKTHLQGQSHGESFITLFKKRLRVSGRSIYLLDEPEAALSPERQFDLLRLMKLWSESKKVQLIMATHSPILMSFPRAQLLRMKDDGIHPITYEETEHFRTYRDFMADHKAALARILADPA